MYNYSLAPPILLGLALRGKEPRGDRSAWLPDKEGSLLGTWPHTSPNCPLCWISIWPRLVKMPCLLGSPEAVPRHSVTQQLLRSGAVGSPLEMSTAPVAWWLSKVFAHLWKRGGENYSAKASGICNQSGGQRKRRCFCERQVSALPRAESQASVSSAAQESSLCPLS